MANSHIKSYSVIDINPVTVALTGNHYIFIRHFSTAQADMDTQSISNAPVDLDSCGIGNGGRTEYGTSATFENVYDPTFVFFASDSDGVSSRETHDVSMIDYIKLTCNASDNKIDADGSVTLRCGGAYFNSDFIDTPNPLTVFYRYRKKGDVWSTIYEMTVSVSSNAYAAYANLSGLDYKSSYDFEFIAKDALMTVSSSDANVSSKPVFHWGESDVTFEVPVNFNEGVNNLQARGVFVLGDSGECKLGQLADGSLGVQAPAIYFAASKLIHNGNTVAFPKYGTWTPSFSAQDAYVSYTTQSGWYIKCGNIVTVGFLLKATVDSRYSGFDVWVYGLPFIPAQAAAGGGMCSGAYVSAGFNFQCFVAGTDNVITTRVQACNNTSNANLNTSASGCKYPYNGGELTVSGTITYMTA